MRLNFIIFILLCFFSFSAFSQSNPESPYELSWAVDGTWVGVGLGLNAVGFSLIQNQKPLSDAELAGISRDNIPGIDRWVAGNYSERADNISYYPFYGSFAVPFLMLLSDDYQPHAKEISVMFLETMSTTGALFTMTAGLVERKRPLVYNTDIPDNVRQESKVRRSFFGGHVAATASATFFAAKIFHDLNPQSPLKPFVWGTAALVPAWVGYLRMEAGKHFFTDSVVGYGIGALSGILIPQLHKKENENFSLVPMMGSEFKGLSLHYRF